MTILDEIIDASVDPSIGSPDLLRKVQVVAHRLGAGQIVSWVKQELGGYDSTATLPDYRALSTNVNGRYSGHFQSWMTVPLTAVPEGMQFLWTIEMREPLSELQALSEGEGDLQRGWPSAASQQYEQSGVFGLQNHTLFSAHNVISRQSLRGILDIVRSKALDFALELQTEVPDAGTRDGPKVSAGSALAHTVYNITNNIYGDGTNVASGNSNNLASTVTQGDEGSLRRAAKALGLTEDDTDEYVAALSEGGSVESQAVQGFLDRVRSGAVAVGGSVASNLVAESLVELGKAFLGMA